MKNIKGDYKMLKMIIELNEEKIVKENEYYLNDVLSYVDSYFEKKNIKKVGKGIYQEEEDDKLIQFLGIMTRLSEQDIFVRYINKWMWYESEEAILHNEPEDLMKTFELKVS